MSALLVLAAALASAQAPMGGVEASSSAAPSGPRLRAVIHRDARDWEPVSLRAGGDPSAARNRVLLRRRKVKGKPAADARPTKASARLHKSKDESWLVISARTPELEKRRIHLEIRFRLVEGYVEEARAVAVTAGRPNKDLDSFELRAAGIPFESAGPASGAITVSALDPGPSKSARNAGTLKDAAFGGLELGLLDLSWSATGVR